MEDVDENRVYLSEHGVPLDARQNSKMKNAVDAQVAEKCDEIGCETCRASPLE